MKHQIIFNFPTYTPTTFPEESIVKTKLSPNEVIPTKIHTFPTILIPLHGTLYVTVKNQTIQLAEKNILIIFRRNPYSLFTDNNGCEFYALTFYPFSFQKASAILIPPEDTNLNIFSNFSLRYKSFLQLEPNAEILNILENMYCEYMSKKTYYTEVLISYSVSLLFLVFREMDFIFAEKNIYINTHLIAALKYLMLNYMNKITVPDIAKASNVSARYLNNLFHMAFDCSLSHFIVSFRIDQALESMFQDTLSLTEIAVNVGFNSLQHFSKAFKEEMGISPKSYQRLLNMQKQS